MLSARARSGALTGRPAASNAAHRRERTLTAARYRFGQDAFGTDAVGKDAFRRDASGWRVRRGASGVAQLGTRDGDGARLAAFDLDLDEVGRQRPEADQPNLEAVAAWQRWSRVGQTLAAAPPLCEHGVDEHHAGLGGRSRPLGALLVLG